MSRILLTGFFGLPAPNRAGVQMRHVLRALSHHHEVDVLVVREADHAHVERTGAARVLRVPVAEREGLRARVATFRRAVRRQLEGADYDVVHFRDGWAGVPVLELRERLGYLAVFDAARAPLAEPPMLDLSVSAELSRSEERCLMGADHVLVATEIARQHVLRRRSRGVHVVPPGVDVDLFDWDDLPPGPPTVLYAGSVEAGRGLRGLLRAMAALAPRSDARLIVAGRVAPSLLPSIGEAVAELGLHERVEVCGEVAHDAVPELVAAATVCVAPSAAEVSTMPMAVYPTKLLEYMACRRAVVAPRRGTTAMLIEDGVHGLLFQPGDPDDLARKVLSLLHDADLRARVADAGYRLVRELHAASATRRALRRAYESMQLRDTQRHRALSAQPSEEDATAPVTQPDASAEEAEDRTDRVERLDLVEAPEEVTVVQETLGPRAGEEPRAGEPRADTWDTYEMPALELPVVDRGDAAAAGGEAPGPAESAAAAGASGDGLARPVSVVDVGDDRDHSSVAGEVEVPSRAGGEAGPRADEDAGSAAVSVLVGSAMDEAE